MELVLFFFCYKRKMKSENLIITRFENNIVPWDMAWYSSGKGNYQEIWVCSGTYICHFFLGQIIPLGSLCYL